MTFHKSCAMVFACVLLTWSCSKEDSKLSKVKAPDVIEESFELTFVSNLNDNKQEKTNIIGIKESSLEKEFLLQGSLIEQTVVPMFNNLKSRIVAFKKVDNFLYMLEATHGHKISDELQQTLVLAKFPIVQKSNATIFFDFVSGMESIFITSDWHGHDFEGGAYDSGQWKSVPLDLSYLDSVEIDDNNLVIRQIAQLLVAGRGVQEKTPVEVKYYLTPYAENKGFVPTVSNDFDKMGFFEVSPQLQKNGGTVIYASKFDSRKKITFAISSNTPSDYRQAIKEGVLYWNKAFGYNAIQVIDAPKGVKAPDFKHNIIQWVDWEDAGFAYADAQMDPRTGEILHAQIFLTSVFAFSGKSRARRLLNSLLDEIDHEHEKVHRKISLSGFQKDPMCSFSPSKSMISSLTDLINNSHLVGDDIYLKVSQDYVREVVAHEVGHTLGLRHNFAGSLATNYPQSAKESIFKDYILNGEAPAGVVTTSSVMEYQKFQESSITGDQVLKDSKAFEYDEMVIQSLYLGADYSQEVTPLFCTDSHRVKYLDCQVFDSGPSLFEDQLWEEKMYLKRLPYILLERYIMGKGLKDEGKIRSLGEVTLNPMRFAFESLSGRVRALRAIGKKAQFLQVRNDFPYINSLNLAEVKHKESLFVEQLVGKIGGIKSLFKNMSGEDIQESKETFFKLLEKSRSGGNTGAQYDEVLNFTENEMTLIRTEMNAFYDSLFSSYWLADLYTLEAAKDLSEQESSKDLSAIITEKAAQIILSFATKETYTIKSRAEEKQTVHLPRFVFPFELRLQASKLLKSKSNDILWGVKERKNIRRFLKKMIDDALQEDIATVDIMSLPDNVAKWVLYNRKILSSLL